ncbi:MAG: hemerythrin family protein [Magnetococcales bacterium]|nr:hemerythrin family protein [Magnetococcales bacterium]
MRMNRVYYDQPLLEDSSVERFRVGIWQKLTKISVPTLHRQHEKLVEYIIHLYAIIENLKSHRPSLQEMRQVERLLDELEAFIVRHFQEEERFLYEIRFPSLSVHRTAHVGFKNRFDQIRREMKEIGIQYIVDLYFFSYGWLFEHIDTMDVNFSNYFSVMGPSQAEDSLRPRLRR